MEQYFLLMEKIYQSLGIARTVNFTAQGVLLPLVERLATGETKRSMAQMKNNLEAALPKIQRVLSKDAENISSGLYPADVLFAETPLSHYMRLPWLFIDTYRAAKQKKEKTSDVFESRDLQYVNESPEYFRRNFHFQKGGYLNDDSAKLYDHQVEVLFSGTANPMRRYIIPKLKAHFGMSDGEGLKFLELGSGTGSLTRSVALAFPKAEIVCVDISPHYLNYAQRKLSGLKRISFLRGLAENLPFKDESFDAVFSCYLFHELPEAIRLQVLQEKHRVVRAGGFIGVIDSLQLDDDVDLNWALIQFPVDFHEPFYKNYTQKSVERMFERNKISDVSTDIAFLTKIVTGTKKP